MFWPLFYNLLVVPLGWVGFQVAGMLNAKVKRGIRGRRGLVPRLEERLRTLDPAAKRVWFHSASLGEFEQAKPIISELKKRRPELLIVVSFFSPSGLEHSKNYKLADLITYLPFDSYRNASRFVGLVNPSALVMLRYDVWPNHLWAARRKGVPTFIASATLQSTTARSFPVLRQFFAALYDCIDYILTVSESDRAIFASLRLRHPVLQVVGDTRYDQVVRRGRESKSRQLLPERVARDKRILVVGSSWREDEEEVLPACFALLRRHEELLVIVVPHEPTLDHLERLEHQLNGTASSIRFSEINDYRNERFIIVDSVGLLMPLYQYAAVAYVGGSFGSGVHNVLEPAAYRVPIVFGPHHENSQEAVRFREEGAAFAVNNGEELLQTFGRLLESEEARRAAGEKAQRLIDESAGATERFLSYLEKVL